MQADVVARSDVPWDSDLDTKPGRRTCQQLNYLSLAGGAATGARLTSDPSDNAALIYDSCRQDTGSRQPVQCVFGSHVIDYPASVAFLKCNLSEQHERCETPEKTTLPPSHPRTSERNKAKSQRAQLFCFSITKRLYFLIALKFYWTMANLDGPNGGIHYHTRTVCGFTLFFFRPHRLSWIHSLRGPQLPVSSVLLQASGHPLF
ncbi:hypothetical protein F2P81_016260 [Scophthalmus maximus]|uniref:Uncharacterized protein n=1 Tax=Scophthalmus maximus TaxID=52904 RepID=A0A6A4SGF0_SCOMX|nr:hypothetical protein F2P81_016260 [Scophthalmus maximus]